MSTRQIDDGAIALPTKRTCPFDPAQELAVLREEKPLCRLRYPDGHIGWLVTSHELAKAVLTDTRFGMQFKRMPIGDPVRWSVTFDAWQAAGMSAANLVELDPPAHTRVRKILAGHFTVRRVEELRTHIEHTVAQRLDAMAQAGPPADLVKVFAEPVALATHCVLLGISLTVGKRFERLFEVHTDPRSSLDEVRRAFREFHDDFGRWIEQKRREPGDDLTSNIVADGELNESEIFGAISFLFQAGRLPAAAMLALGPFALLAHPEQLEALRATPTLINNAVEELVRYLTVSQTGSITRRALEDVELNGITVRSGESVTVSLAAANRDPTRFDHPDALDLSRSKIMRHLGFGQGIHMCLGQHVARLELQIGILALIQRFPSLRLAIPIEKVPVYSGEYFDYGVHELPATW